jgi:hypothetical protein
MKTPHVHKDLIIAWANGQIVEIKSMGKWQDVDEYFYTLQTPVWYENMEYRIKPEPKPDLVYYGAFDINGLIAIDSCFTIFHDAGDHIKVTFDGETGKLKSAEVL